MKIVPLFNMVIGSMHQPPLAQNVFPSSSGKDNLGISIDAHV